MFAAISWDSDNPARSRSPIIGTSGSAPSRRRWCAFPSSGFCSELADLFELTEPVAWDHLGNFGTITKPLYHGRTKARIGLTASYAMPYEATEFAYKESQLDELPFGQVK
jgi:hypothetical protein